MHASNVQGRSTCSSRGPAGVERIVHCSACAVALPGLIPVDESPVRRPKEPIGPYKRSKYLARSRRSTRAKGCGLGRQPFHPVALGHQPTPTGKVIVDFLNGRMPSYVETGLNLVDVRDVAEALSPR